MLEKTKATVTSEIVKELLKITVFTDPAPMDPMPGEGLKNIVKALKEDLKKSVPTTLSPKSQPKSRP